MEALTLEIKTSAESAAFGIVDLVTAIDKLKTKLGGFNVTPFTTAMKSIAESVNSISADAVGRINALASAMERLSRTDIKSAMSAARVASRSGVAGRAIPSSDEILNAGQFASGMSAIDIANMKRDSVSEKLATELRSDNYDYGKVSRLSAEYNKLTGEIDRLANAENNEASAAQKSASSRKTSSTGLLDSLGRVAKYRMLRAIVTKTAEAFKQGLENYKQWSAMGGDGGVLAGNLNAIAASANTAANALGASLGAVVNALTPVITWLAGAVVTLGNALSMLISIAGGSTSYIGAVQTSLDGVTASAGGAGGAMKDLLADWDELNVIQSSGGGGGGGGVSGGIGGFEEFSLPEWMLDENGDLNWIGRLLQGILIVTAGILALLAAKKGLGGIVEWLGKFIDLPDWLKKFFNLGGDDDDDGDKKPGGGSPDLPDLDPGDDPLINIHVGREEWDAFVNDFNAFKNDLAENPLMITPDVNPENWEAFLTDYGNTELEPKTITVEVVDNATPKINSIKSALDSLPNNKEIEVSVNNKTEFKIMLINAMLATLDDKTITISILNNASIGIGAIRAELGTLNDKTITINVTDNASSAIGTIKSSVDSLVDKTITISVTDNATSAIGTIKSSLESVTDKAVTLTVNVDRTQFDAFLTEWNALADKTITLNVKTNQPNFKVGTMEGYYPKPGVVNNEEGINDDDFVSVALKWWYENFVKPTPIGKIASEIFGGEEDSNNKPTVAEDSYPFESYTESVAEPSEMWERFWNKYLSAYGFEGTEFENGIGQATWVSGLIDNMLRDGISEIDSDTLADFGISDYLKDPINGVLRYLSQNGYANFDMSAFEPILDLLYDSGLTNPKSSNTGGGGSPATGNSMAGAVVQGVATGMNNALASGSLASAFENAVRNAMQNNNSKMDTANGYLRTIANKNFTVNVGATSGLGRVTTNGQEMYNRLNGRV